MMRMTEPFKIPYRTFSSKSVYLCYCTFKTKTYTRNESVSTETCHLNTSDQTKMSFKVKKDLHPLQQHKLYHVLLSYH